ncbi:MAG: outer membrane lipoprotein carrier protein LolA [Myxococcota bacterium]|nr:outer membrane lipoprotein carrier protein LolA [Myxococcota bacterium]
MPKLFRPVHFVRARVVAVCAVSAAAAMAQTPQKPAALLPDQAVSAVQSFYDKSQTFQSDFQQKFWVKAYNQEKSSKGHVTFAKPGKMDWVYEDPRDNRVVSDGLVIRVYEAANKQMFEQPVDKSQYPAALSFLTGTGRLSDAFAFEVVSGDQMKFTGGYVLVGTPKQPTPAYSKVLFYVDTATSQVRRVMIIDGQGNRNRFDFVNPRVNEPVKAGEFSFTPPPGTSVVRP